MKDKSTRIQAACKFNCRDVHDASILTLCEHPAAKACGNDDVICCEEDCPLCRKI